MVEGEPSAEKLAQFQQGIQRKAYHTLPAKDRLIPGPNVPPRSKPVTPHRPTAWIELKLREGKKRQIRHIAAAVGLPTLHLIRVTIGPVRLGNIEPS
jgi:23S rRNA pseudouridine2457 synthase